MSNMMSQQATLAAARARVCGDWFIWIAGFSVINSLVTTFSPSTQWGFAFGLGITQVVDGFGQAIHAPFVGLAIDVVIAAIWVFFGMQARKAKAWAFITGMIFYVIDAVLLVLAQDWFGIAVHAYALFRIFPGLPASREYASLMAAGQPSNYYGAPTPPPGAWPPPPQAGQAPPPGAYPPPYGQQQPGAAYPTQPAAPAQPTGTPPPSNWPQASQPQPPSTQWPASSQPTEVDTPESEA